MQPVCASSCEGASAGVTTMGVAPCGGVAAAAAVGGGGVALVATESAVELLTLLSVLEAPALWGARSSPMCAAVPWCGRLGVARSGGGEMLKGDSSNTAVEAAPSPRLVAAEELLVSRCTMRRGGVGGVTTSALCSGAESACAGRGVAGGDLAAGSAGGTSGAACSSVEPPSARIVG